MEYIFTTNWGNFPKTISLNKTSSSKILGLGFLGMVEFLKVKMGQLSLALVPTSCYQGMGIFGPLKFCLGEEDPSDSHNK